MPYVITAEYIMEGNQQVSMNTLSSCTQYATWWSMEKYRPATNQATNSTITNHFEDYNVIQHKHTHSSYLSTKVL